MSSFFQAFTERALETPGAAAVVHPRSGQPVTTYGRLHSRATHYAHLIVSETPPCALVPILANKSAESIACSLGCLAAGRPFAWINKRLRAPQVAEIFSAARASHCIIDAPGLMGLGSAMSDNAALRKVKWLVLADASAAGNAAMVGRALERSTALGLVARPIEADRAGRGLLPGIDPGQSACCLFTSGSTGGQKGVLIEERDLLERARSEAEWYGLAETDRLLSVLPFSFDVGLNQLMSALVSGACLVVQESWLPSDIVLTSARERITGISAVPALWRDFLSFPVEIDAAARSSLRYVTVSGGSLSAPEQERLQTRLHGVGIFKTYGQTETFRSASLRPEELSFRPGSVGRAYASVRVVIADEDGKPCGPGETGEIVHLGLGTMLGYLNGVNGDKIRSFDGERAVFTGDYGYLDEQGYLFLKGRRDGMIKVAGNRVYPEEVAHQLRALPVVREVEVIALEETAGERVLVAFVSVNRPMDESELRKAAANRLPAYMVPRRFVLMREIPRLGNGKPDRVALMQMFSASTARAAG